MWPRGMSGSASGPRRRPPTRGLLITSGRRPARSRSSCLSPPGYDTARLRRAGRAAASGARAGARSGMSGLWLPTPGSAHGMASRQRRGRWSVYTPPGLGCSRRARRSSHRHGPSLQAVTSRQQGMTRVNRRSGVATAQAARPSVPRPNGCSARLARCVGAGDPSHVTCRSWRLVTVPLPGSWSPASSRLRDLAALAAVERQRPLAWHDHSWQVAVTRPARPSPAAIPRLSGLNAVLGAAAAGIASVPGASVPARPDGGHRRSSDPDRAPSARDGHRGPRW